MNTTAKCNKNKNLSIIAAVFMSFSVLFGLQGCNSSGGGGTTLTPVPEVFITRVSAGLNGTEADANSLLASISSDGRYVVFESDASNLVANDTNNVRDIFVRDMQLGSTIRVSVDSNGIEGGAASSFPSITADGRYVAYKSSAENLVSNDGNGADDYFIHDTQTGSTTRVSVNTAGTAGNGNGFAPPSMSSDGRYVAFESLSANLVDGDLNGQSDIFLRDTKDNITTRISVGAGGEADGGSFSPEITSNFNLGITTGGNIIAFTSDATNLVVNDANGVSDVFIRNISDSSTSRVSVANGPSALEGNARSIMSRITPDGRYVLFTSAANNLIGSGVDTNSTSDVFVRDTQSNTTIRISVDSNGVEADKFSLANGISSDGQVVVFTTDASNLVPNGATNGINDVYVHDIGTSKTSRVNVSASGIEADGDSEGLIVSADGRYVVFNSSATNLISDDNLGITDIFRVLISKTP